MQMIVTLGGRVSEQHELQQRAHDTSKASIISALASMNATEVKLSESINECNDFMGNQRIKFKLLNETNQKFKDDLLNFNTIINDIQNDWKIKRWSSLLITSLTLPQELRTHSLSARSSAQIINYYLYAKYI